MTEAPAPKPAKVKRLSRLRSLVWLVPERVARRLGWFAAIAVALVPLVILLALIARERAQRTESRLAAMLGERLGAEVRIAGAVADAPGHWQLFDVTIEPRVFSMDGGRYLAPPAAVAGRLDLENGTLDMSLDDFAAPPSTRMQKRLEDARAHADLRAISLTSFGVRLALGEEYVSLNQTAGRIELTDEGDIHGALTGRTAVGRLSATCEIGDAAQSVTVTGKPLPWTPALLAPTLGETLAKMLVPGDGTLVVSSALATGIAGDVWKLDAKAALDLARFAPDTGLGGMTGALDVAIDNASGALGGAATIKATLRAPKGGTMPAAALKNLAFLLDTVPGDFDDTKPVAFESLDLAVIITRDQVYFTSPRPGTRAALYAPGGKPLLLFPTRAIPLRDFARRLDELQRRWEAAHAG